MGIGQYLKDTQGELRHVAWPTRLQTIVYTLFVALISIAVSLYLGLFDFLFTTGLSRAVSVLPASSPAIEQTASPDASSSPLKISTFPITNPTPSNNSGQAGSPQTQ